MMTEKLFLAVIQTVRPIINDDTNDIASAFNNKAGAL